LLHAALTRSLIAAYEADNVADEHPSGFGTKIDVVVRHGQDEFWYYEIKTATSPRACLREALGQVLEYAYWPGAQEPSRLIVCGESRLDDEGAAYLRRLNERFRLPIAYEHIAMEREAQAMFDDLITYSAPPPNRLGKCEGDREHHLPEGAVMVAFAMHLLRTVPGLREVSIHPDGEHGKRFDFQEWLGKRGFVMITPSGKTRCTVHKHRNLLAHAPERLHEESTSDYNDMIYAATRQEIETRRKAFIRKWRLNHRAIADSLEEAGDRLFTFTRLPPSQWRSARTTNAIERLYT
jgi:hypothetical protein